MSGTPLAVPHDQWQDDEECVVMWLYEDGDAVAEGTVVCELAVAKVDIELPSPAAGVLRILVPEETPVRKGDVIAVIEDGRTS